MNTAIIVAAGSGSRFKGDIPKQFVELAGKPVIIHTLEKFEACDAIDEIVLVLSEDGQGIFERMLGDRLFTKLRRLVAGGATRAQSVKNGLDAVDASCQIVAVHDGARPLVTVDEIASVISAAKRTGAACLVAEVTDTVKHVENGSITRTVDRSTLRRALTPQAFGYDILRRAFEGVDLGGSITDECYLVEKLGVEIACVEGDARNIKITRAEDLVVAGALIQGDLENQRRAVS